MKAFILAAGLGTRLRSLGLNLPKVMVPVGGKPLLEHHLELFRGQGIREFIINLHYLPERVTEYFGDGRRFGVQITYSVEPALLGTAGAVKKMEPALAGGRFLVVYGDNLLRFQLAPLAQLHEARRAVATLALFESPEPWTGGVVETDPDGRVRRFVEKPPRNEVSTNLINAGIYLLEPAVLGAIPAGQFADFGKDIFPRLVAAGEPVYALRTAAYVQDVGTPERLAKAQQDYATGALDSDR
jgi:NDP-sugar pyrophosphorylase family protein